MSEKQKARLENWYVGPNDLLYGVVYGHPKISDGTPVSTSRVVSFNPETKKAETLNTHYELGNPFPSNTLGDSDETTKGT